MKLFDDVVPVSIKCPACGVVSISDHYSNRDVWRMMTQDSDTLFFGTQCNHVFELSKVTVLDRNGHPLERGMRRQDFGAKRFYALKAYGVLLGLKDAAVGFAYFLWHPMLLGITGMMSMITSILLLFSMAVTNFTRSDFTVAYLASYDKAVPFMIGLAVGFLLFGIAAAIVGFKYADSGE